MKKYSGLTQKEMSGSGQALVLICLIVSLFAGSRGWVVAALVFLVLNMACPGLYKPFAFAWLNFSNALGAVVSRVVLALEFFLLVLPVGMVLRLIGRDAMAMKKWRQGKESVFVVRDHQYTADDLKNPY